MNRYLTIAALSLAAVPTVGGAQTGARAFAASGFDAIELTGVDDVRIISGPTTSVVATGDPRAVAALSIAVRGTMLTIGRRPGSWRDRGALITVTTPTIRTASISGSGGITASGVAGPRFAVDVSGSGTMRLSGVHVGEMRITLGGSGDVIAEGHAGAVSIKLGGSGDVDTHRLTTPTLRADLSGSGDIKASASGTARITASGSGDVAVTGGARCSIAKSGTADVSCG